MSMGCRVMKEWGLMVQLMLIWRRRNSSDSLTTWRTKLCRVCWRGNRTLAGSAMGAGQWDRSRSGGMAVR